MEVMMTEKALNTLLALQISQETMQELKKHPLYEKMMNFCKTMKRDKETMESLENMPLGLLQHLRVMAVCHKMREPLIIVEEAIQANLNAQQRARKARILADKAEQEADKAEQWLMGVKELQKSIKTRLNSTQTSEN